jgi:hypothetical protein
VATFEPARYSGEDAASLVASFTRAERLCGAGKTLAATRVVESHRHTGSGHRSGPEWLASLTGESVGNACDVLKLGQALDHHPEVEEAFREGRLSGARATLVAGAARVNPSREHELVEGAAGDTLRQLKARCLKAKAEGRSAGDAARHAAAIRASRRCRTWTDTDGAFRLDALLTPEAGASVLASLGAQADRFFEQGRKSGLHEPPDAYAADALVALVTGRGILGAGNRGRAGSGGNGGGAKTAGRTGPGSDPGSSSGSGSGSDPGSSSGSGSGSDASSEQSDPGRPGPRLPDPKAVVHVRVDLDALRRGSLDQGEVCEIPGVGPIPVQSARDLLGDALCHLVITNGVDVTTVCRLGRSIPAALDVALTERDRCCVVPGCDVTQGLERDHWRIAFADGGPTCLENLALLCAHHHYQRTHQRFRLHGGPGRWGWEPPDRPPPPTRRKKTRAPRSTPKARPPGPTEPADPPLFPIQE